MIELRSITFNNKNSIDDLNLCVSDSEIGSVEKQRVVENIPYKNGTLNFSSLYGEETFEEITLKYTFDLLANDSKEIEILKNKVKDWLLTCGENILIDSSIIGLHYKSECISVEFDDDYDYSFCTATFKAYPFKIGNNLENEDWLWDPFCFETDVINQTIYEVNNDEIEIKLYNVSSHKVVPEVSVTGNLIIEKNKTIITLSEGIYKSYKFKLDKGENIIKIRGEGTIKFNFYKEVL